MKILDRYIAKSFLVSYAIAFCVLIGLRIVIDLFINLDEFVENADLGTLSVARNILTYYGFNTTLYFRDFAGMITVVAAAFSLGKMVRTNELIAIMASGVNLKRVVAPFLVLALILTGVLVVDQEVVIPALSDKLVRSHDAIPGQESYIAWFIPDLNGSLLCSPRFEVKTASFSNLTILLREPTEQPGIWKITGCILADKATYDPQAGQWDLTHGRWVGRSATEEIVPRDSYQASNLLPKNIPVMVKSEIKTLLSWRQLTALGALAPKDVGLLYSQKHFRITEPIISFVMLMVSLPVLVCRDPKATKSAVMVSLGLTAACAVTTFVCKMLSTEPVLFGRLMPEFWAWLPVFIFMPVALIELDSMKT
jgi:lipopolysaccharide export LptBFGC system permease protein LptF